MQAALRRPGSGHPDVGQREQGDELRGVLCGPAIPNLVVFATGKHKLTHYRFCIQRRPVVLQHFVKATDHGTSTVAIHHSGRLPVDADPTGIE